MYLVDTFEIGGYLALAVTCALVIITRRLWLRGFGNNYSKLTIWLTNIFILFIFWIVPYLFSTILAVIFGFINCSWHPFGNYHISGNILVTEDLKSYNRRGNSDFKRFTVSNDPKNMTFIGGDHLQNGDKYEVEVGRGWLGAMCRSKAG